MPTSDLQIGTAAVKPTAAPARPIVPKYQLTFVESPNLIASIVRQLRAWLREPKITVDKKYYRGEAPLPIVEMKSWYHDLPNQIRFFFATPKDPIGFFNRQQEKKRTFMALGLACLGAAAGWAANGTPFIGLGVVAGYALGYAISVLLFKKREYPPDIWRDYQQQAASWVNSLLVHALGLAALLVPFLIHMAQPVKASTKYEVVDISPYLNQLEADQKKAGGGGGGGDRTPTPPTKAPIPKFSKQQLAPPVVKIPNLDSLLPVQPTLLGPPELKLPQMQASITFGDPQGVLAPDSNGPGFGGGIGTGDGGGIGPGHGAGLGPGEGGAAGGGVFSVGGNVSAPVPIYQPMPAYSEEARKAKFSGTVVIWIVVDAQGNVQNVRVVKPLGLGLDEKAAEAVRTWRFKPGMRNGAPVAVQMSVEVLFRLL
jgi:TonB family protein